MKFVILTLLIISNPVFAVSVQILKNGSTGDLKISGIELPSSQFESDFKSGLSTMMLASVSILSTGKVVAQDTLKLKVYYDLWDELFYLQQLNGNSKYSSKAKTTNELFKMLESYTFPSLIKMEDLKGEQTISINFVFTVDPITKEKKEKIKKWLAQNQVNTPRGESTASNSKTKPIATVASTAGRGIFNQILDSELSAEIESARWIFRFSNKTLSTKDIFNAK